MLNQTLLANILAEDEVPTLNRGICLTLAQDQGWKAKRRGQRGRYVFCPSDLEDYSSHQITPSALCTIPLFSR